MKILRNVAVGVLAAAFLPLSSAAAEDVGLLGATSDIFLKAGTNDFTVCAEVDWPVSNNTFFNVTFDAHGQTSTVSNQTAINGLNTRTVSAAVDGPQYEFCIAGGLSNWTTANVVGNLEAFASDASGRLVVGPAVHSSLECHGVAPDGATCPVS